MSQLSTFSVPQDSVRLLMLWVVMYVCVTTLYQVNFVLAV